MSELTKILLPALRQYQHNDCSGLIAGYDFAETKNIVGNLLLKIKELENTRTQSQWIEQELSPAIKKCFKSLIGCDGVLMVAVDDYNELVDLINKETPPKEQCQ